MSHPERRVTEVRIGRRPAVSARIDRDLLHRSRQLSRQLTTGGAIGLVHGDLHPGNVLRSSTQGGIVAIDPRPCIGDRCYDLVDWILADVLDEAALDRRLDRITDYVPGVEPERARAWCRAMAVVVAASMLARKADDSVANFLIDFAATQEPGTFAQSELSTPVVD